MPAADRHLVRRADVADATVIAQLLDEFNREYDDPTPGPAALSVRVRRLIEAGDTIVLLGGERQDGVAVLRFRLSIWNEGLECYLAELYIRPERRGQGLGRALMASALREARERGADTMDLGTSETDVVARHLYESLGFTNHEGGDEGPLMYVYERTL
jgi:ribosomal protein S18 acetylase RimI-like enzyme